MFHPIKLKNYIAVSLLAGGLLVSTTPSSSVAAPITNTSSTDTQSKDQTVPSKTIQDPEFANEARQLVTLAEDGKIPAANTSNGTDRAATQPGSRAAPSVTINIGHGSWVRITIEGVNTATVAGFISKETGQQIVEAGTAGGIIGALIPAHFAKVAAVVIGVTTLANQHCRGADGAAYHFIAVKVSSAVIPACT